jgi:hypothetical protein
VTQHVDEVDEVVVELTYIADFAVRDAAAMRAQFRHVGLDACGLAKIVRAGAGKDRCRKRRGSE